MISEGRMFQTEEIIRAKVLRSMLNRLRYNKGAIVAGDRVRSGGRQ